MVRSRDNEKLMNGKIDKSFCVQRRRWSVEVLIDEILP
jgi:hypothetical protein